MKAILLKISFILLFLSLPSSCGYNPILFRMAGADLQSAPLNRGSVIHIYLHKKNFNQPLFA